MKQLLALLLFALSFCAHAQPAGCSSEAGITGRSDVKWCEDFDTSTWWQRTGYVGDARKTSSGTLPVISAYMVNTSIVSTDCISGNCLRVECYAYDTQDGGCTGMLAIYLRIPDGPHEEIYYRYYLYLAPNWSPASFCADFDSSFCTFGEAHTGGGKWPGISDGRGDEDGGDGQCGNGGNFSDGLWCWTARLKYMTCSGDCSGTGVDANSANHTRLGFYWYLPPVDGESAGQMNQAFGPWDNHDGDGTDGDCDTSPAHLGSTNNSADDNIACGFGDAGLERGHWYRIEAYHRMNTAGVADGIARAWVTKVGAACSSGVGPGCTTMKYEKTNILYREVGHDGLNNRLFFFNFHHGGEMLGPAEDTYVLMDQLVITTGARAGAFKASASNVSDPFDIHLD
jgi:hypothetical protein